MECVLRKFGSYENFEEVTGGTILPKSQVWAAVRKYLQKEGCVGEVSAGSPVEPPQLQVCHHSRHVNVSQQEKHTAVSISKSLLRC